MVKALSHVISVTTREENGGRKEEEEEDKTSNTGTYPTRHRTAGYMQH